MNKYVFLNLNKKKKIYTIIKNNKYKIITFY